MQYTYKTASGDIPIEIDEQWARLLEEMDKQEKNKKIVAARHEVYSGGNADFFDSLPFYDLDLEHVAGKASGAEEERVQKTLSHMKPKQAELLKTIYIAGFSQAELANKLGVSKAAVSQRVKTAKENFQKIYLSLC